MPTYDYRCSDCGRLFEKTLSYREYNIAEVICPHCAGHNVQRRIGRVRVLRTDDSRMHDLDDPSKYAELENDPQAMGRMMRKMSAELGEDMGPEFNEMVSRLEAGQSPEEIEASLPQSADELDGRSSMDEGPGEDLFKDYGPQI